MATAASDSDIGSVNEDSSGSDAQDGSHSHDNRPGNPSRKSQETHRQRQSERTVRITETTTESFKGLDELSSCINSVDDHVQAGLQELRNCVTNLKKERTEMTERVRNLVEEVRQTSVERDHYQVAIEELQQEIGNLREQLSNQQQDRDALYARMQSMERKNENHLVSIAEKQRSKRIVHRAVSRWRKKTLDKRLACSEQIRILEAENNDLRAELLLCQEAAKQAFLRSANALNSEALTMFQDAATRRLGFDEMSQESDPSNISSPPRSPCPRKGNGGVKSDEENKENRGPSRRPSDWNGQTDRRGDRSHEDRGETEDDRSYVATHGSDDRFNSLHRNHSFGDLQHQRGYGTRDGYQSDTQHQQGYGTRDGYQSDTQHQSGTRLSGTCTLNRSLENLGAGGGAIPPQNRSANVSSFQPDALQQETREYLQRLREERQRRSDQTFVASGFESQRKLQKMSASHSEQRRKKCTCRPQSATVRAQAPYRCPYCTPVQNSSFGHAKELQKKTSNVTRSTILSNTNTDKKKISYKPSASTIVIEKHITR